MLTKIVYQPDGWHRIMEWIPFLAFVQGKMKLNSARVIEGLIIAGAAALIATYLTVGKIEVKIEELKASDARIEQKVDYIYKDIYRPFLEKK